MDLDKARNELLKEIEELKRDKILVTQQRRPD